MPFRLSVTFGVIWFVTFSVALASEAAWRALSSDAVPIPAVVGDFYDWFSGWVFSEDGTTLAAFAYSLKWSGVPLAPQMALAGTVVAMLSPLFFVALFCVGYLSFNDPGSRIHKTTFKTVLLLATGVAICSVAYGLATYQQLSAFDLVKFSLLFSAYIFAAVSAFALLPLGISRLWPRRKAP